MDIYQQKIYLYQYQVIAHEIELIEMHDQVQRVNQLQRQNGELINESWEDTILTSVGSHKNATSMKGLET